MAAAVALVLAAVLLLFLATGSVHWGLDGLMGTWIASTAHSGDRVGLRGEQSRLRVEYTGDSGVILGGPTHVHIDGTVDGARLLGQAEVGDWSLVSQQLRLDLDDGRWTLEVENDLLVVTDPEGRETELARIRQ